MKKMKILGLIALVAIIGLGMVACDEGECEEHDMLWDEMGVTGGSATTLGDQSGTCKDCDFETTRKAPGSALLGTFTVVGTRFLFCSI